jgi:RND family efflux transporter MFP subunit
MTSEAARPEENRRMQRRGLLIAGLFVAILLILGMFPRIANWLHLKSTQHQMQTRIRSSKAVVVQPGPSASTIVLPGDTQAVQQIPILARANGYVEKRLVDIGSNVKKDQVLAVLSTPELDQQLAQAKAQLCNAVANYTTAVANYQHYLAAQHAAHAATVLAQANVDFSKVEDRRYELLAHEGAVSWEVRDTYLTQLRTNIANLRNAIENESAAVSQTNAGLEQVKAAKETVDAAHANEKYYAALQAFKMIRAPYDGVITARYIDVGALIAAGGGGTQILAMASPDILTIFVQVPQSVFRGFKTGQKADVIVPEFQSQHFPGIVTNISGGLDPQSRTLQVEVRVDNRKRILPAGVYAQVAFHAEQAQRTVMVPINAVSTRPQGNIVAIMRNGRAYLSAIDIHRDYGSTVESTTGVKAGDVLLLDPPDDLQNGEPVHAVLSRGESGA